MLGLVGLGEWGSRDRWRGLVYTPTTLLDESNYCRQNSPAPASFSFSQLPLSLPTFQPPPPQRSITPPTIPRGKVEHLPLKANEICSVFHATHQTRATSHVSRTRSPQGCTCSWPQGFWRQLQKSQQIFRLGVLHGRSLQDLPGLVVVRGLEAATDIPTPTYTHVENDLQ